MSGLQGRGSTAPGGGARPLRIALLNPTYWPEVRRGVERQLHDLGIGLAKRGLRPTLITSHAGPRSTSLEDGFEVVRNRRLPEALARRLGYTGRVGHLPRSFVTLRRGDYDLAHAVYPADAVLAVRWSRRTGRPAVFSVMGAPAPELLEANRVRRLAWGIVRDESAAVVALTEAAAAAIRRLGGDPRVIYPGVDLAAFTRTAERAAEPTIFCPAAVGAPGKRVDLLIAAFELLRARGKVRRLVLSDHAIPPMRLPEAVELRNLDRHQDLVRTYSEAWLTVLPSEREGFGLVLLESLACGTPVVGRRVGGIPEIVDRPEIGVLFDAGNADDLAAVVSEVLRLADDPGTAPACRRRATQFPLARWIDAHVELYGELLSVQPERPSGGRAQSPIRRPSGSYG